MDKLIVGIADGKIARKNQILVSYAIGSCVGVCLYDKQKQIAGMVHIVLPGGEIFMKQANPYKFADQGIRKLIQEMVRYGADPYRLTAKIAGGANMFQNNHATWEIGARNIEAVKKTLLDEKIYIAAEDIGKNYGRTIFFFSEDGKLEIHTARKQTVIL